VAQVKVVPAATVPPGQTHFVEVGGVPVILANYEGEIHAFYGICPHQNNPLEGATLWARFSIALPSFSIRRPQQRKLLSETRLP
jgi:nitrite reductase/ring-hydroxylating ferredoxin subunit